MNLATALKVHAFGTPVGARKGWDTRGYALDETQRGRDGKEVLMRNGFFPARYGEAHVDDSFSALQGRNYEAFQHPSGAYAMVNHDPASGNTMFVKSGDSSLLDKIDSDLKS